MSNSLDPDQDRRPVGPNLGPNCLKGCKQMTKVATCKERANTTNFLIEYYVCSLQVWLALASLCVLNQDHVERLTSGEWVSGANGTHGHPRVSWGNLKCLKL